MRERRSPRIAAARDAPHGVALCILVNGAFETAPLWHEWLSSAPAGAIAGVAVHASNLTDDEACALRDWCAANGALLTLGDATRWCDPSVASAQWALVRAARRAFPHATHVWTVSEQTAPVVSARRLEDACRGAWRGRSCFQSYCGAEQRALLPPCVLDALRGVGVRELRYASQFALLAADAVDAVDALWDAGFAAVTVTCALPWAAAAHDAVLPIEEFLVPTLLAHAATQLPPIAVPAVVANFEGGALRAAVLTDDEACRLIASLATAATECSTPPALGVRKIACTRAVHDVLHRAGVL